MTSDVGKQVDLDLKHSLRSTVRRGKHRASYNRSAVHSLVDRLKLGHIGYVADGGFIVIPMTVWRVEEHLYLHTLNKSRLHKHIESGGEVCISFAQASEWVLAKSAFHHSVNYESAVLFCRGERVRNAALFDRAFATIIDQIEAQRWDAVRPPNASERKATALIQLRIVEGSYKSRSGGPSDEPEDLDLPVHNGVLPICPFAG